MSRLDHILPPREWVRLLLPTYAEAACVDDAEAQDRLARALSDTALRDDLAAGLTAALAELRGPKTDADQQLDRLSKALGKRHNFKPAPGSPALSAVLVRIGVAAGLGEGLAEVLKTEKGKALYAQGLAALSRHLAKELVK